MENKTKEQLAEEYVNLLKFQGMPTSVIEVLVVAFERGYDSRQPEIDALKEIISGKTFHDETEVLKAEIHSLIEEINKLKKSHKQSKIICPKCKGVDEYLITKLGNYKCAFTDCKHIFNPPKQTKP